MFVHKMKNERSLWGNKLFIQFFVQKRNLRPITVALNLQKKSANICGRQKSDSKSIFVYFQVRRTSKRFSSLNSGFGIFHSHIVEIASGKVVRFELTEPERTRTDIYKFYANINLIISPSNHPISCSYFFDLQLPIFRSYIFNF